MIDPAQLVGRFYAVLVQEIRQAAPRYLDGPFTVAEIYQDLVPYRVHRDAIGVEMNGDYEDTLLRLLSGEGDFLILESGVAQRALREELQQSNPNTGLFRDFAAVDVRLNPDKVEAVPVESGVAHDASNDDQGPPPFLPKSLEPSVSDLEFFGPKDPPAVETPKAVSHTFEFGSEGDDMDGAVDEPVDVPEAADVDKEDAPEAEAADSCQWCAETLPGRNVLNFCPHCGGNLTLKPCAGCGEELEAGWGFCPVCGDRVG